MKKLLLIILLTSPFISFGQISSNAPATVSAFGGKYNIQFNITAGIWYNTRSASVDYGGITFPFAGAELVSGPGGGYYFTVDPNASCQRDLKIILQDVTNTYGTYTITITQLSTVPALSILPTITGPSTVCSGDVNTFKIATSPGSYTTWLSNSSMTTVLGNVVAPITVQWYTSTYGSTLYSSSISGGVLNAIFTSSGFIISARENGCSAILYDTLNVSIYPNDSVSITPTVDNVVFGTPITFSVTGTSTNPNAYIFWIKNGNTEAPQQTGYTYTYNNFTYGDTVYATITNYACGWTYGYSKKVAIIGGTAPVTDIRSEQLNNEFKIYPNPFSESFIVENSTVISITDLLGNTIPFTRSGDRYYVDKEGLLFINTDKGTVKITQ